MTAVRTVFYHGLRWLVLLLALFQLPPAGARPAPGPVPAPSLDGLWKGPLQVPGGQLEVIFRLVRLTSGEYYATLDVPLQKATHLPVEVTQRADTVVLASDEANCRFVGRLLPGAKQLAGTWHQPGFVVVLTLTRTEQAPPTFRPVLPYRDEEVAFNNPLAADLRLAGNLSVPTGPGPFPAVVLLSDTSPPDHNGSRSDFAPTRPLADYLTRHGVAVLRLDNRGTGRSGGAAQANPVERVSDAQAALSFLRTRPEIDWSHLGLVGHGEGGNVALMAATQPLPPAYVVCLAPYGLPGGEVILQQQEAALRNQRAAPAPLATALKRQQSVFEVVRNISDNAQAQAIVANMLKQDEPTLTEAAAQARAAELVAPRYRFFLSFNPVKPLLKVACPVLLLYGTDDAVLNPDNNLEALSQALKNNKALEMRKLPGVNHLFEANPAQWPLINGEPKPVLSPVVAAIIRAWVVARAGFAGK